VAPGKSICVRARHIPEDYPTQGIGCFPAEKMIPAGPAAGTKDFRTRAITVIQETRLSNWI
jgi:hypothetical protein